MSVDYDIDLIEKFYQETLTDKELEDFKIKLDHDPEFAKTVEQYRAMLITMTSVKRLNQKSARKKWVVYRRPYLVPVAASLFIVISLFFLNRGNTASEIARDHFINERFIALRQYGNTSEQNRFHLALDAYFNNEKQKAITLMTDLAQDSASQAEYFLILGDLYFEMGQANQAIYYYDQGRKNGLEDQYAQWNKAMAYLFNNQSKEAIDLLMEIAKSGKSPHRENAKKILDELDAWTYRINPRNWFANHDND